MARRPILAAAAVFIAGAAYAQTNPLASVAGRVMDPSGAPLAGATVTVTSTALQGTRTRATAATGDFLVPVLPPGDYEIVFRLAGFREARLLRSLRATETARVDVQMELEGTSSSLTVTAEPPSVISQASSSGTTYPAPLVDRLPVDRSPFAVAPLAPGVAATGPASTVVISGGMPYENLYLLDGVGVKDRVNGQPRPLSVEDAIEETTVAAAGISAELGRFAGGVVNLVTKSGGNAFAGSMRVTLENEAWRARTPYERERLTEDPREDSLAPAYEGVLGGPIVRDRLWYFLAGRWEETSRVVTLAYTDLPYVFEAQEKRLEVKLTWSPLPTLNVRAAYGELDLREENHAEGTVMDVASLSTGRTPEDLLSVNTTATLGRAVFLEGQLSRRRRTPTGLGARATDLVSGTLLVDSSRGGARWNSPFLCGVCGVPEGELREAEEEDRAYVLKGSGFFSHPRLGAHTLVVGGEIFDELRRSNSFQSGSGYIVNASAALLSDGGVFAVFRPGGTTVIEWRPLTALSAGSRFRTTSLFVNDSWRLGSRWSFNVGLRWDADDSRDQSGQKVGESNAWSPRLAAAFDPGGDGVWTIDAGFARYVASLNFGIGDLGTRAGRTARYLYTYDGPAVNAAGTPQVTTEEALATLFGWFFANGGTSRPLRQAPGIPGLNRRTREGLGLPRSDEVTLGVSRRFGASASARIAGVWRDYANQYSEYADTPTGKVTDPGSGRTYDLFLVGNSDRVERTYLGLFVQLDARLGAAVRVAGSYTLSDTRGNFDALDAISGAAAPEADLNYFPEYGDPAWRAPSGAAKSDQRHKVRLWGSWNTSVAGGALTVSALERVDSGQAYSAIGMVDSRPYVANPGYVGPPARVPYYFEGRGARRTATVVATDLSIHFGFLIVADLELFTRAVVVNLFDQAAQTRSGSTTVLTAANDSRYAPFDPFTQTPVRGVHWDLAPGFGSALSAADFAPPRSFNVAFGLRF